jgi:hypothetical protein
LSGFANSSSLFFTAFSYYPGAGLGVRSCTDVNVNVIQFRSRLLAIHSLTSGAI